MSDITKIKIACGKSIQDWKNLESKIKKEINNVELWEEAFSFFECRMMSRYLSPIETIKASGTYIGEGFAIVAILCSLIEALESFYQGVFYRKSPKKGQGEPNNPEKHYYCSEKLFISFLENREPFKKEFSARKSLAKNFYEDVRCAILHEAATRNGWRIRIDTQKLIIEKEGDIVLNRNIFIDYVIEYIEIYKNDLFSDILLKKKFIQKMNSICQTA